MGQMQINGNLLGSAITFHYLPISEYVPIITIIINGKLMVYYWEFNGIIIGKLMGAVPLIGYH